MRNYRFKNCTVMFFLSLVSLILAGIPAHGSDWVFSASTPGGHRGPIAAIVHKGNTILSAGEDGFLEIWDTRNGGQAAERFQVSLYRILAMAERPGTNELCLLESDGMGMYRISVWNSKDRKHIFSRELRDPISSVCYSMGGRFIIAARTGRSGLVFLDSISGNTLQSPQTLIGAVGLAATGRSDRNMVTYLTSGRLSYWELESGNETSHFDVPANLLSPVLFANSRYLAGVNAEGLAVINAVTGELLVRDSSVRGDVLLCPAGDELICLVQGDNGANAPNTLYRYTIDKSGRLHKAGTISLPNNPRSGSNKNYFTTIAANGGNKGTIALGTNDGNLLLAGMNGQPRILTVKEQVHITDAEVSGSTIAFLADNGAIAFIPLNYSQLTARKTIQVEPNPENYTRITAFSGDGEQFVFWQDSSARTMPVIRSPLPDGKKTPLEGITFRSPISSADSFGGKILFLDSMGNLSVISPLDGKKPFSFFSVGLMDAAFIDQNRLIIGRSAVSGNTPFMIININTGETVPLSYPAQAGVIVRRGAAGYGGIYAAAVSSTGAEETKTFILQLNLADIAHSALLADFPGEETSFSLADASAGNGVEIATTIGGQGAAIYSGNGSSHQFDRTGGHPLKLMNGGSALISLDRDGNICWHDRNGKLLAVFRLHPTEWTLQTERGTISGGISR